MAWWERAYLRDRARPVDHGRHLPAQHGALDDRPQGRAHDLLPRGNARRLRAAQPRQAHADAAPRRQAAVHRVQPVRDRLPGQGDRDRGRLRPGRHRTSEVSRRASRSTTRAASSAACASRRARRTPSAWSRRRRACRRPTAHRMWLAQDELLHLAPARDVAKPYPAADAAAPHGARDDRRRAGHLETLLLLLLAGARWSARR